MDKNTAAQLLFDKKAYYTNITRTIRWFAIALVLGTYPLFKQYTLIIMVLLIMAIIYNILWYFTAMTRERIFSSYITMNAIDNGFVLSLVILSGGVHSPYYILFTLMAITAAYWYGYRGLITLGVGHVLIAGSLYSFIDTPSLPSNEILKLIILIVSIIIAGVLAERLTKGDRFERETAVKAHQEIENERQRLLALLNSIGDGVIALDKAGKAMMYNGAALELLNTNMQLTNQPLDSFLKLFDVHGNQVPMSELFKTSGGIIRRDDLSYKSSDNSLMRLDLTISPITSVNKTDYLEGGFILIMKDITKEKTLDETRDEFVAVTSHELKTPLAIAEGNLSVAMLSIPDSVDPKIKQQLNKAHESVLFLGALVEDLSTLARADRGILDVDLKMVDPIELINRLREDFLHDTTSKNLQITTSYGPDLHPILTSSSHIYEVLQNFINNAIKYTQNGGIELRVDSSPTNKGSVIFSVKDTGIGISTSDKKKIFEKFFRSEDYRTRTTGGTGLGLYITKKLADRLSGHIWFESELNKGSTFYLEVPPASKRKEDQGKVATAQVDDFVSTI